MIATLICGTISLILGIFFVIFLYIKKRRSPALRITLHFIFSFIAILLFSLAAFCAFNEAHYDGELTIDISVFGACWKEALDAFAFKFPSTDYIVKVLSNKYYFNTRGLHAWFAIGYWASFASCAATSISAIVTIVFRFFGNRVRVKCLLHKGCDILINGDLQNEPYMREQSSKRSVIMAFTHPLSDAEVKDLYYRGIAYLTYTDIKDLIKYIFKHNPKTTNNIVYYRDSDEKRLEFITAYIDYCDENKAVMFEQINTQVRLFISFSYDNFSSVDDLFGSKIISYKIHLFNKYELFAQDFQIRHSFFDVLRKEDIDKCCLKEEIEPKIIYVGFGKVNQEMFRVSVMNNQFAYFDEKKKRLQPKPITYYFFDKDGALENDKCFNYLYHRFIQNEQEDDLRPFRIGNEDKSFVKAVNAFSNSFVEKLLKALKPSKEGKKVRAQIFISLNDDLNDIDLALKIKRLIADHPSLAGYVKVYVRVKNIDLQKRIEQSLNDALIATYGDEAMLCHDHIVAEKLIFLEDGTHAFYEKYSPSSESSYANISFNDWRKKEPVQFRRNAYECINDFLKMKLLGYSLAVKTGGSHEGTSEPHKSVSSDNFFNDYLSRLMLDEDYFDEHFNIKNDKLLALVERYNDFLKNGVFSYNQNLLTVFALSYQEKLRWNAFHIMNGYAPLPFKDMLVMANLKNDDKFSFAFINNSYKLAYFVDKGIKIQGDDFYPYTKHELMNLKKHGCLTSVEGLIGYHDYLAKVCYQILMDKVQEYIEKDNKDQLIVFIKKIDSDLGSQLDEEIKNRVKIDENTSLSDIKANLEEYLKKVVEYQVDTYRYDIQNAVNLYSKYIASGIIKMGK